MTSSIYQMLQRKKTHWKCYCRQIFSPLPQTREEVFFLVFTGNCKYICTHVAEEGSEEVKGKHLSRSETFRRSRHGSKKPAILENSNRPQTFLRWKSGGMDHPIPVSERFGWFENFYHNHNFTVIVPKERKSETTTCSTGVLFLGGLIHSSSYIWMRAGAAKLTRQASTHISSFFPSNHSRVI